MLGLAQLYVMAVAIGTGLSSDEILTKVADNNNERQDISYSGLREYKLRNARLAKEAAVLAQMTYVPREGKHFTVLERSGSPMLARIVEKLLAYETDESRPPNRSRHEIGPSNYQARLLGTESRDGRTCYVMDLTPKHNSRYLIKGTVWVDPVSYSIVHLDGWTSSSVSMWVGTTRITEEFSRIAGLWLPSHTRAVSSGFLLGTSELEISYSDYRIANRDNATQGNRALVAQPE